MRGILIFLAIGLAAGEKLGLGYLPPPGAQLSGGSPGDIQSPFAPPDFFNIQPSPNGQYTQPNFGPNNFVIGSPQKIGTGNIDTFAPDKIPTTTTTYAFSQTTTFPEGYETTVLPIDPVTGLPIQSLDHTRFSGQLGNGQSNQNIPIYENKVVTIGSPNYGANDNQLLNQHSSQKGNVPVIEQTVRYPNDQYQYGDKIPQYVGQNIIIPGTQQAFTTTAPVGTTAATTIPTDEYNAQNINLGSPEIHSEGGYSGLPIHVQETNLQFNQPSYNNQEQTNQDIYSPLGNINSDRPFKVINQDSNKPGLSPQINERPFSTSPIIPTPTPSDSPISPIYRQERPQAASDRNAVILNFENIRTPNDYSYSYDTSNGIHADEAGVVDNGTKAKGKYSYIGDDGKVYSVSYTADENGFRPYGDHLPTPPPVPEAIKKVIEQAARDKASGIEDDGSYDEAKYGHKKYQGKNRQRPQQQNQGLKNGQLDFAGGRNPATVNNVSANENSVEQSNPKDRSNNVLYGANQLFSPVDDKKSFSPTPGATTEEINRQQYHQQTPSNIGHVINIKPSNDINYSESINQSNGYGKTRPGTNVIETISGPGNFGYPDNNSNQNLAQTPEFNQYNQQYKGQPQLVQNYKQAPYNYNGNIELQSRPQSQTIDPSYQQNENGYYYQAPNAVFNDNQFTAKSKPQGNLSDQTGPITVNNNLRDYSARQPTIRPGTKFNVQNPSKNYNIYTTYDGGLKPLETGPGSILSVNQPQITDASRKTTIPLEQKTRYTQKGNALPGRKDNTGSYAIDSTPPMPLQTQNTQKIDASTSNIKSQQPFNPAVTSTTGRPFTVSEYTTQTPTYTTGYPTENYGIRGSPGYNPSFSTTPNYPSTYKSISLRPGYSITKAPSTTRYYADQTTQFPESFSPVSDSKYQYTPGQLVYSTSSPTTARPSTFVTSRIPVSTTTPYGPGYQSLPGGISTANGVTYPSGNNAILNQSQSPGFSQIRPLAPGTKIPGTNKYKFSESPYTFGMKYGNGPQIYSSTTSSSPTGSGSFSPVSQPGVSNQGYYTQTSTTIPINTLVDALGRPVTSETVSFNGIKSSPDVFSAPDGQFGTSPASFNTGDSNLGLDGSLKESNNYPHNNYQGKVIGEDFSGPKQPQRFDPETGYHY